MSSVYAVRNNRALWAGRTLRAWTDLLVERLVEDFDPAVIVLFGSVAEGNDGPDSDIDLLVVLDDAPPSQRRGLMVDLRRASRGVAAPHDLLVTSVADFERRRDVPGTTEHLAAHRGVVMHERVRT